MSIDTIFSVIPVNSNDKWYKFFLVIILDIPIKGITGVLRSKYETLRLGVIIHFIHNLIVLSLDYYYFDITLLEI